MTGVQAASGHSVTLVVRGSNKLVLEEAERSIHDALCVIRCLVKKRLVHCKDINWNGVILYQRICRSLRSDSVHAG